MSIFQDLPRDLLPQATLVQSALVPEMPPSSAPVSARESPVRLNVFSL